MAVVPAEAHVNKPYKWNNRTRISVCLPNRLLDWRSSSLFYTPEIRIDVNWKSPSISWDTDLHHSGIHCTYRVPALQAGRPVVMNQQSCPHTILIYKSCWRDRMIQAKDLFLETGITQNLTMDCLTQRGTELCLRRICGRWLTIAIPGFALCPHLSLILLFFLY